MPLQQTEIEGINNRNQLAKIERAFFFKKKPRKPQKAFFKKRGKFFFLNGKV